MLSSGDLTLSTVTIVVRTSLIVLVLLGLLSSSASAFNLRCAWDQAERKSGGAPLDAAFIEAGRFYGADQPLHLRVDLSADKIEHVSDVDKIVLGFGTVSKTDDELRIRFNNPKMKGLGPFVSELAISVDRFSLSSTMILATRVEGQGMVAQWLRRGTCLLPRF